jgi:hypothetical protein
MPRRAGVIIINNVEKLMRMPYSEGEDLSNIEIRSVRKNIESGDTCTWCTVEQTASRAPWRKPPFVDVIGRFV